MVSKRRSIQLSQARANRVYQPVNKQRIAIVTEEKHVNSRFRGYPSKLGSDNLSSNSDEESEEPIWYWNNSSDDEVSDSDEGVDNSESDSEPESLPTQKQRNLPQ